MIPVLAIGPPPARSAREADERSASSTAPAGPAGATGFDIHRAEAAGTGNNRLPAVPTPQRAG